MERGEYVRMAEQASALVERGAFDEAIGILRGLIDSDISDVDKSMMCLNLAVVYEKTGDVDEALDWYASGEEHERPHGRFFVAEKKAAFLAEHRLDAEGLASYEALLGRTELTEDDKARIGANIDLLRSRMG